MNAYNNIDTILNITPIKYLCILVPAPLWYLICINFLQCAFNWGIILHNLKIYAETTPPNGANRDDFSEQH